MGIVVESLDDTVKFFLVVETTFKGDYLPRLERRGYSGYITQDEKNDCLW